MEMREEPYNYVYLTAFENMLKYGNKDYISTDDLIKYKNRYLKKVEDYKKIVESEKIKFEQEDDIDTISDFLSNYEELFYEEDDKIFINDDITFNDIDYEILELTSSNEDSEEVYLASSDSEDLLEIIGADYTNKIYTELLKNELEIEKSYIEYFSNPSIENKKILNNCMKNKFMLLEAIKRLPDYKIEALRTIAIEKEAIIDDDYEYDEYPYNEELWSSIEHADDLNIDEILYSTKHFAIYSELPLYYKKLASEIETIYLSSVNDEFGYFNELAEKKKDTDYLDQLFYIKYIDNMNEYISNHDRDDDLVQSRNRLIYAIDNPFINIYDNTELNNNISFINNIQINKDELSLTKDEVMFLIGELFIKENEYFSSQKLLYIKTYYDLTHDEDIKNTFENFKGLNNYNIYKDVIFGKNKVKKI